MISFLDDPMASMYGTAQQPGFMSNPGLGPFAMNAGLAMLAAGQGGGAPRNRWMDAAPYMQQAVQAPMQMRQQEMMQKLYGAQLKGLEQKQALDEATNPLLIDEARRKARIGRVMDSAMYGSGVADSAAPSLMPAQSPEMMADASGPTTAKASLMDAAPSAQPAPRPGFLSQVPDGERMFALSNPTEYFKWKAEQSNKPPTVQEFNDGEQSYKAVWDPTTRTFNQVGSKAPRWQDDKALVEIVDPKDPTKTKMVPRGDALNQEGKGSYGMVMMPNPQNPSGPPIVMQGNARMLSNIPGILGKSGKDEIDKALISATAQRMQLNDIKDRYKPEYQEVPTRLGMDWTALKDKAGGMLGSVSPEDRAKLDDYVQYRASATQNFSTILKDLSGAAVTESELKRAEAWLPNPGTGIGDGDSPTQLKSKVDRFSDFNDKAVARLHYIQRNDLSLDKVPLDDMPKIIRERGDKLAEQFSKQKLEGDALKAAVKDQLAREFGLVSK